MGSSSKGHLLVIHLQVCFADYESSPALRYMYLHDDVLISSVIHVFSTTFYYMVQLVQP